jgi:hypothetical protein
MCFKTSANASSTSSFEGMAPAAGAGAAALGAGAGEGAGAATMGAERKGTHKPALRVPGATVGGVEGGESSLLTGGVASTIPAGRTSGAASAGLASSDMLRVQHTEARSVSCSDQRVSSCLLLLHVFPSRPRNREAPHSTTRRRASRWARPNSLVRALHHPSLALLAFQPSAKQPRQSPLQSGSSAQKTPGSESCTAAAQG